MGLWGKLGRIALGVGGAIAALFTGGASLAGTIGSIAGAAGSTLGAVADAKAANRDAGMDAATVAEQLSQARRRQFMEEALQHETMQREGMREGMRNAAIADYVVGGGRPYVAPTLQTSRGSRTLPTYGLGPKAPGEAEVEAAYALADQNRQRMAAGGSLAPKPVDRGDFQYDPNLMKPGKLETIAGIGGVIGTSIGALRKQNPDLAHLTDDQLRTGSRHWKAGGRRGEIRFYPRQCDPRTS